MNNEPRRLKDIRRILSGWMSREYLTDIDSVNFIRLVRMCIESSKTKQRFPVLFIYGNWCGHDQLSMANSYRLLARASNLFDEKKSPDATYEERLANFISFDHFFAELFDFFKLFSLDVTLFVKQDTNNFLHSLMYKIMQDVKGAPISAEHKLFIEDEFQEEVAKTIYGKILPNLIFTAIEMQLDDRKSEGVFFTCTATCYRSRDGLYPLYLNIPVLSLQ